MDHTHQIHLPRHLLVGEILSFLAEHLGCDNWYVACHHEHMFVFRLTQGPLDRFAVKVECTPPVEKAVYHDCKAWSLALTSLHEEKPLNSEQLQQLQSGLEQF